MGDFVKDHLIGVKDSMYQKLKEYGEQKYEKKNCVTTVLHNILQDFFNKQAK